MYLTDIRYEVQDPVAVITLDRPATLNALSHAMLRSLRTAIDAAVADERVVGIVITGAGRGFCSGLDAALLQDATQAGSSSRPSNRDVPGLFTWLLEVPKPIIAAVNGVAAGGGFVLAVMCDIRIASTEGSFTSIFAKRGLIGEHGTTWILPRIVGTGAALDLLWSSRRIDAARAERIGLVHDVVPAESLVEEARAYVAELATVASPASMADTKRLVYGHWGTPYPEALAEIDDVQYAALDRPDASEGARALLEKRDPAFPRLTARPGSEPA